MPRDPLGQVLTTSAAAAAAYGRGVDDVLLGRTGAAHHLAASIVHDPTFALGHAALALLGHEGRLPVDVGARLDAAALHARRSTERERSHVQAVIDHVRGHDGALVEHLLRHPDDALLLSVARRGVDVTRPVVAVGPVQLAR